MGGALCGGQAFAGRVVALIMRGQVACDGAGMGGASKALCVCTTCRGGLVGQAAHRLSGPGLGG